MREAPASRWRESPLQEERGFVGRALPKRVREFAAGRACARQALEELGISEFILRPGPDRAPLWPPDVVGSIAHCDDYCVAAVADRRRVLAIGVDVERTGRVRSDLLRHTCVTEEIEAIGRLPIGEGADWAGLFFSAKEAFYKCYWPGTGQFLGFHDVVVTVDPAFDAFSVEIRRGDKPALYGLRLVRGRYSFGYGRLHTAVAVTASDARD